MRLHPGWKPAAPRDNNLALLLLRRPSNLPPVAVAGGEGGRHGEGGVRVRAGERAGSRAGQAAVPTALPILPPNPHRRPALLFCPTLRLAADFAYPVNATAAAAFGFGSLSADGVWPQLHSDQLTLLPEEECGGLQTAYGPRPQGQEQACTGGRGRLAVEAGGGVNCR